jgi:hypothetical protein
VVLAPDIEDGLVSQSSGHLTTALDSSGDAGLSRHALSRA